MWRVGELPIARRSGRSGGVGRPVLHTTGEITPLSVMHDSHQKLGHTPNWTDFDNPFTHF